MQIARIITTSLTLLSALVAESQPVTVHIPTSDAIDLARMIARNEGYDVTKSGMYTFDLLTTPEGKPFHPGYTSIGFEIDGHPRNLIVISNSTGQAIDYDSCEVFAYPGLKPFQESMIRLTKAKRKSPEELADDVGCGSPKVLNKPVRYPKYK